MVVDDSSSMRQMVNFSLAGAGYQVVEAVDGADALAKCNAQKMDLIITDLNMPNMNGLEFIRALRQLAPYRGVPIVFLTTESDEEVKKQAKAAGATGWITKPFQQEQLVAVVKKVLG